MVENKLCNFYDSVTIYKLLIIEVTFKPVVKERLIKKQNTENVEDEVNNSYQNQSINQSYF